MDEGLGLNAMLKAVFTYTKNVLMSFNKKD